MTVAQTGPPIADRLRNWLAALVESGGSDLHLVAGHPPVERLHGELLEYAEAPLAAEQMEGLIHSICTPEALDQIERRKDVDFSFVIDLNGRMARFRANLFHAG